MDSIIAHKHNSCRDKEKQFKWVSSSYSFFLFLFISATIFFFAGCAVHQPVITSLSPLGEKNARALLDRLTSIPCPDFIDTDITVTWYGYGQKRMVRLGLQATKDGRLRASGFDPLSRPFFIFVTDGYSFTMVDNRHGKGYTGQLDSDFIHSYIPEGVSGETMFLLLAGLPMDNQKPVDIVLVRSEMANYYRYSFIIPDGYTMHSEINTDSGLLSRQFITNKNDEVIITVGYDGSVPINNDCHLPLTLEVEGEAVTGTVQIVIDKVYGDGDHALDDRIFLLQIPEHFTITEVE